MPRNGSGVYSLPSGSDIASGDPMLNTDVTGPINDLEADANTARPVVAGGTGATNAADARTNLGAAPTASPTLTAATLAGSTSVTGTFTMLGTVPSITFEDTNGTGGSALYGGFTVEYSNGDAAGTVGYFNSINLLIRSEREDVIIDADRTNITPDSEISLRVDGSEVANVDSAGFTVTGQVAASSGSGAAPAYAGVGDLDAGMYFRSGNPAFAIAGSREYEMVAGSSTVDAFTVINREKGDARYLQEADGDARYLRIAPGSVSSPFMAYVSGTNQIDIGDTFVGTNLVFPASADAASATPLNGTYRCLGFVKANGTQAERTTLLVLIA